MKYLLSLINTSNCIEDLYLLFSDLSLIRVYGIKYGSDRSLSAIEVCMYHRSPISRHNINIQSLQNVCVEKIDIKNKLGGHCTIYDIALGSKLKDATFQRVAASEEAGRVVGNKLRYSQILLIILLAQFTNSNLKKKRLRYPKKMKML